MTSFGSIKLLITIFWCCFLNSTNLKSGLVFKIILPALDLIHFGLNLLLPKIFVFLILLILAVLISLFSLLIATIFYKLLQNTIDLLFMIKNNCLLLVLNFPKGKNFWKLLIFLWSLFSLASTLSFFGFDTNDPDMKLDRFALKSVTIHLTMWVFALKVHFCYSEILAYLLYFSVVLLVFACWPVQYQD